MPNVQITDLPAALPLNGTELVPIVQGGVTVRTTTAQISSSPNLQQTFLTKNQELSLPNSRYLSTGTGLGLTDGGADSFYRISLNGVSGSLETAAGGIIVKNSGNSVIARSMATSGNGLSVSNADGTGGNPTLQLTGVAAAIANLGGTGLVAIQNGTTIGGVDILGTANQITVANGNGVGNPTIGIASDPVLPGTGGVVVPKGSTAQQPVGTKGEIRYNTDTDKFEGYSDGSWRVFNLAGGVDTFSAGTTGLLPNSPTIGAVVLSGVLNPANGGTGVASPTGYIKGNGALPMTASSTIPTTDLSGTVTNAQIQNPQVTFNGTTVALGGAGTITAATPNSLTFGTGMTAGSFNGSVATSINLANTGVSAGSYGAASKTLTATVNAQGQLTALADTPIAIANTQVSGLGTLSTQNANNVAITGGTINGTVIGGSTPAAGTFTNVTLTTGTISTTPVNATDIANKAYVDAISEAAIHYHQACKYAAASALNATYSNGASGVGATLTNAGALVAFAPDGPTASVGDRILVFQQANAAQNGVYVVTTVGNGSTPWVLTRSSDTNTYSPYSPNALGSGDAFFISAGNTQAGNTYVMNTTGVITFGTTSITFVLFQTAQIYSAGTGLTLTGTQFSITNTGVSAASYGTASSVPTVAINAQGQITSASNTPIAINANQITTGTITNSQLQNSSVTVNGTSISLGGSGTVTATATNALTIGTGLTGTSYNGSAPVTIALGTTGVVASTYGSASQVPVFAVDAYGRLTSVTNTSIAISAGAVSGLAASATTDTTNASNITSGTLPTGRLSGSYTGITGVGTLTAGTWNAGTIGVGYGGTGLTATPTNGQLPIGNGTGFSLGTLTAGTNVTITNTAGGIKIDATPSYGGTVTSVAVSGGTTGLTTSGGPITTSGTITLAGTLIVANGGTGATTLTGYVKGNGTSAMSASTTIPNTDITGLGTMSTQNANSVAITGGTIDGTTVGATTASTVRGTTVTATTQFSGPGTGLTGTASGLSIGGNAATATSATTATNLAGGANGSVPYQTGSGATSFLAGNTTATPNFYTSTGTGVAAQAPTLTSSTGSGNVVLATSPTLVTPNLGTPSTLVGTNITGTAAGLSIGGNAATATTATTATNVAGGLANQIVYQTGAGATSFITAPSSSGTYLEWNGTSFVWASAGTGSVTSVNVSGGTTGLTTSGGPVTTSGTITLAGTLAVSNGGTGATTLSGVVYGNGTSAFTAATGTQIASAIGTTAVTNATNATNTAITANSTNADYYITVVSANTGNLPQLVATGLTANPSTGKITGGIAGGTF